MIYSDNERKELLRTFKKYSKQKHRYYFKHNVSIDGYICGINLEKGFILIASDLLFLTKTSVYTKDTLTDLKKYSMNKIKLIKNSLPYMYWMPINNLYHDFRFYAMLNSSV